MSDQFGWSDPVEGPIKLAYRRKGERHEYDFSGPVYVLGEDGHKLTHVPRAELGEALDLTRVPVIGIGGKRKQHHPRILQFLQDNQGFAGAFLTYPGTGNWDLGEGMLVVTSLEILAGKRVSGGRPEVQLINYRWLRDGRFVADRAKLLHNKVLETLEAELEQEPGAEKIAEGLVGFSSWVDHRLRKECELVWHKLFDLERKRVLLSGEQSRDMHAILREHLLAKLKAAGVRFVRDIPADLTVTAEEIVPDLVAQAETLGTIEVPGLGCRLPEKKHGDWDRDIPTVALTVEEVRQVTAWPFTNVRPVLAELGEARLQIDPVGRIMKDASEAERWARLRSHFAEGWLRLQRERDFPKELKVADPHEADPPTLEPVVWGTGLFDNVSHIAYPALVHVLTGWAETSGWAIRWFKDPVEAAEADAKGRHEAGSFMAAARLERELTAETAQAELPITIPGSFVPFVPTIAQIADQLGFTPDKVRFEGSGPGQRERYDSGYWSKMHEDWRGGRNWTETFWHQTVDEVHVVFANIDVRSFIGTGEVRNFGLASTLGATNEQVQSVHDWIKAEEEKVEAEYREKLRQFVQALRALPEFVCLPSDLQAKLAELPDSYGPGVPAELADRLRAEWPKAVALCQRQSRGETLVNWGGHYRRMGRSSNCDYWVIRPDGSLRDPDEVEYRKRYTSEGNKRWRLVGPEEIALSWGKSSSASDSTCSAEHAPATVTPKQFATVWKIEEEIGVLEGAFGLNPAINRRNAERLTAIREVASKVLRQVPEFGYYQVAGSNGVLLEDDAHNLQADLSASVNDECDGRSAWVVRAVRAGDGVLEFLAYDKYGRINYAMRWRVYWPEEDPAYEPPATPGEPLAGAELGSALDALRAKFGKK